MKVHQKLIRSFEIQFHSFKIKSLDLQMVHIICFVPVHDTPEPCVPDYSGMPESETKQKKVLCLEVPCYRDGKYHINILYGLK